MSDNTQWLAGLKPGDKVAMYPAARRSEPRIAEVERLTATQVVTKGGGRYRLSDGRATGRSDYWSRRPWLAPLTDEIRAEVKHRRLRETAMHFQRWHEMSAEQLARVCAVIFEFDEAQKRLRGDGGGA